MIPSTPAECGAAQRNDARSDTERVVAIVDALAAALHPEGAGRAPTALDTQLERDLGFDSLARAELIARIEQAFDRRLAIERGTRAATVRDLLDALTAAPLSAEPSRPTPPVASETRITPADAASQTPHDAATLVDALRWHAAHHPERTHVVLVDDAQCETRLPYLTLFERACAVAGGLSELGVEAGDSVALMLPTGIDYLVCFSAILLCGAVAVPVYPPARLDQIEEHVTRHCAILDNAQATTLIGFERLDVLSATFALRVPSLRRVLTPARIPARPLAHPVDVKPADLALLQYTSGSTGQPKGVTISHAALLANIRAMGERLALTSNDVLVSWLPLYHDMGLIGAWLAPLYYGIPLALTSPTVFLARPERWLGMIARFRGTITAAPNFAYERCVHGLADAACEGLDLSSLRLAFCGSEPVSATTLEAFAARFAPHGFDARALTAVYGLAENVLGVTFAPPSRGLRVDRLRRDRLRIGEAEEVPSDGADAIRLVGCGFPLRDTELRIVDDDGRSCDERRIGHIVLRGRCVTAGYFRDPEKTAAAVRDGWLDTGDLGYLADGELFVTGRSKDVIIRGGRHFFPDELEAAIGRLPAVAPGGVAVCGSRDPRGGTERIVVIVECAQSAPKTKDETRHDIRDELAANIRMLALQLFDEPPGEVRFVAPGSIPRTPAGKVRRSAALERLEAGRLAPRPVWRQMLGVAARSAGGLARAGLRMSRRLLYGAWCGCAVTGCAFAAYVEIMCRRTRATRWSAASRACRRFLRAIGMRIHVAGASLIVGDGPNILVANHTSYLDALALLAVLPMPVDMVAKRELSHVPLVAGVMRALGAQFVDREHFQQSVQDAATLAAHATGDTPLLFFPEGTFVRRPGLRPFHLGAFTTACAASRPVVPLAIRGARAALRDGDWLPTPGAITITALAAIAPDGMDFEAAARLRDRVRAAILPACGEPDAS